jgi:hypothetical protein
MNAIPTTIDRAAEALSAAGWSIGDVGGHGGWIVHGSRGDQQIEAHGATQAEAWQAAIAETESMPSSIVEQRPR